MALLVFTWLFEYFTWKGQFTLNFCQDPAIKNIAMNKIPLVIWNNNKLFNLFSDNKSQQVYSKIKWVVWQFKPAWYFKILLSYLQIKENEWSTILCYSSSCLNFQNKLKKQDTSWTLRIKMIRPVRGWLSEIILAQEKILSTCPNWRHSSWLLIKPI